MTPVTPSTLVVALLGMAVVFVFLVFLSAMMAALTAISDRKEKDKPTKPDLKLAGIGSAGWIAGATAAYLEIEQATVRLPSAAAWRPYETEEDVRWRLQMPPQTDVIRQVTS